MMLTPGSERDSNMLDSAAEREEALEASRDIGLHLQRRHARIEGSDHGRWNVQRWKHIDRHSHECGDPQDRDDHGGDNHRMWITQ